MRPLQPHGAPPGGGFGLSGPVPRDLWLLLGIVFASFSLQFFEATRWLPDLLRLTPAVWQRGFVWQLVTYPFVGSGAPGFWFVLELLILFLFGRDVFYRLGRRGFWRFLVQGALAAALVAVAVAWLQSLAAGGVALNALTLMQGQHLLIVLLIAAFATLNANATILLFFVLPIQARWFILLELVFAFMGYLGSGDLAGFLGLVAAVGAGVVLAGGTFTSRPLRELWLRLRYRWFRTRLAWIKRRRRMRVVPDREAGEDGPDGPWVH